MAVTDLLAPTALFYYLLLPAVILYYAYYRYNRRRLYELAQKLPGPDGLPLIGSAHEFIGRPAHEIFSKLWERSVEFPYDAPVKMWIGSRLIVFLQDPRDIELILSSNVHLDKSPEYRFFQPWFGNGLLISSGDHWRSHRKLIAPTFHLNVLKSFIDLFNHNSRGVVEKMRKEIGHEFDAHEYMSEATVEILLETAMGVNKKEQENGFEYAMAVMKMCDILHLRHTRAYLRPEFIFRMTRYFTEQSRLLGIIHGLTTKVIRNKKVEFNKGVRGSLAQYPGMKTADQTTTKVVEQKETKVEDTGMSYGQSAGLKDDLDVDDNDVGEKKRLAFLDLLIESAQNGVVLTDQDIKEEVDTIMFEGHDTTAAGSSFFLCMMGLHQHMQDKVVEELNQIFGDSDRPATFQDTLEMKFLERCLLETLRMYPPVPIIARELREEVKAASSGHIIPAGCTVVVATVGVHRRPDIYPNPDTFDPDNFLPDRAASRHYYAFVPFSAGPRSCVGRKYAMLKLKILLSTILRNYRVHATIPEKNFQLTADIILKRADGFKISLEPRKKSGHNITGTTVRPQTSVSA